MTTEALTEKVFELDHRITSIEDRSKSNTKRLDKHDKAIEENGNLISTIKELAVETKYMREDLNKTVTELHETIARINKLENKDSGKWDKFKWLVLASVVSILVGFIAGAIGLK